MYLLYVGVTHKESPLSLLERVHFFDDDIQTALKDLKEEKSILENVIVSTCNRTELYLVVDQLHTGRYYAKHFLANWFHYTIEELETNLVFKEADAALAHLLRVSIGLESKIIGETQILGQLKQAFSRAQEAATTGVILNEVFRQVLTFAKKMHDHYQINARPISIGLTAVQWLDKLIPDYQEMTVAVIGLGDIGGLVANYLLKRPFKQVMLVNRTIAKAEPFLSDKKVTAHTWQELEAVVAKADIVFSAIKTDHYVIFPSMLKPSAIVFDLCLPRTCHPSPDVELYSLEHLNDQLDIYQTQREEIAKHIGLEVEEELVRFNTWKKQLGIVPIIRDIREHALKAQATALDSLNRKLPNLSEREQKQIAKHMKGIINQILKEPILQIKEMSVGDQAEYDIALVKKIFGLTQDH